MFPLGEVDAEIVKLLLEAPPVQAFFRVRGRFFGDVLRQVRVKQTVTSVEGDRTYIFDMEWFPASSTENTA